MADTHNYYLDSILTSIKGLLGIEPEVDHFDTAIIPLINAALSSVNMLGVGPLNGFTISDNEPTWQDFIGDREDLHFVKTYVWHKVRLVFDPPQMGYLVSSIEKEISECEWRLMVQVETPASNCV